MALDAADVRAHAAAERGKVTADIARAQHQHVGVFERGNWPQILPAMFALQVMIAWQALHHGKDHGKHVLAHGLAVGAHRAGELSVGWHGAGGQVIVIARGLQLQQLEVLTCGKQGRVYVAQNHVGVGDLFARGGVGARVDKVLARSARFKNCAMTVVDGQQNQDVHKQSSPLNLPKRDRFILAGFIRQNVQTKTPDARRACPSASGASTATSSAARSRPRSPRAVPRTGPNRCRPWCARTSRRPC